MILVLALVVILLASLGILTFRRIGTYHPEKYAYRYLGVVGFFTRILYPFYHVRYLYRQAGGTPLRSGL
ncbi:MAG: hypothetical protein ACLU6Y_16520 [Ruminococcus sp.]